MSSYPPPGQGNGPAYPPPPGGPPPWAVPGPVPNNDATWALVIAIASLVLTCCCGLLGVAGGIVAIVLAQQVRNRAARYGPGPDTSTAVAAFWVGVAAVAVGAVSLLASLGMGMLDTVITL